MINCYKKRTCSINLQHSLFATFNGNNFVGTELGVVMKDIGHEIFSLKDIFAKYFLRYKKFLRPPLEKYVGHCLKVLDIV